MFKIMSSKKYNALKTDVAIARALRDAIEERHVYVDPLPSMSENDFPIKIVGKDLLIHHCQFNSPNLPDYCALSVERFSEDR